jgi:hypothetical protein
MKYLIRGASVRGPLHVKMDIPCQDALAFKVISPAVAVVAIADGLGSATKSDVGSKIAVDAVVCAVEQSVVNKTPDEIDISLVATQSIAEARAALENAASVSQCQLSDFGSTLISIVLMNGTLAIAHIGDGSVIARVDSDLRIASAPGESEYTNEVKPLTAKDWQENVRSTAVITNVRDVIAFTDGCQRAALKKSPEGYQPFGPFCLPILDYLRGAAEESDKTGELERFLSSEKLCNNSDDDKTLIVINLE